MRSTPDDLVNYAKAHGFEIDPQQAREFVVARTKAGGAGSDLYYQERPRVLTNLGDGVTGAFARGIADPFNVLDEVGGFADTLAPNALRAKGQERVNVWDNKDQRFGDILANNIEQNRQILDYDEANHPYARLGGQVTTGVLIPGASIEEVGLSAATRAIRAGGTRYAARIAAEDAIRSRIIQVGAAEGAAAGFGAGKGGVVDRLPGTVVGGISGAAGGAVIGTFGQKGYQVLAPKVSALAQRLAGRAADDVGSPLPPDMVDGAIPNDSGGVANAANPAAPIAADGTRAVPSGTTAERPKDFVETVPAGHGWRSAVIAPDGKLHVLPEGMDHAQFGEAAGPDAAAGYASISGHLSEMPLRRAARPTPAQDRTIAELQARGARAGRPVTEGGVNGQPEIAYPEPTRADSVAMAAEHGGEGLHAPELSDAAPSPSPDGNASGNRPTPVLADVTEAQRAAQSASIEPGDLLPLPASGGAHAPAPESTPPVRADEGWGQRAPNYAGNINLDNLDSPQNIDRALTVTGQKVGGFDAATRGKITQAETESLASELGMTPADLLARRKGEAFNAEQALAARQILAKSGNELVNLAKRVQATENPGDELLAQFRQAWTRHVAIQEQVSGATAEAGRALAQFRMLADSRVVRGEVLKALADGPHGPQRLQEAADAIVENAGAPGAMNNVARLALKPTWKDKLVELYYNSILSGPATHVVNTVSNTMTALGQIPEHAAAAVIGAPRVLTKSGDDRVLFSEVGARAVGMLQGTQEGMRQAARTFMTGKSSDLVSKVESQETHAISGIKGSIIRTPTRALSAADELYKAIARRSELAGLAVRRASAEGLAGEAATKRVADLVANPPEDLLAKAFDYGRYVTFQRPLGPLGQGVSRITQNHPLLKLIIPFVRTPVNIMKFAAERSPAAPLMGSWRSDVKAGGAARDLALAKMTVGTGVMATAMDLASKGYLTGGGPADENAKGIMRADGWQPYSVKIDGKYYSYSRLDPFATTLGVAADFADLQSHMTLKQQDEVALLLTASTIKNLSDKTWFSGVSDLAQAIHDPERYGPSYIRNRVASVAIPGVVAQGARTVDPTLRQAQTLMDAIRARVPGMSSGLPAQLDVWGRPIVREGGLGPDIVSPASISTARNDPANAAALAVGATVGKPAKKVGGRDLSPSDYANYATTAGALAHTRVMQLIRDPAFKAASPEDQKDMIEGEIRDARAEIRDAMFGSPGEQGQAVDFFHL
jgi:hypothetical protein